MQQVPSQGLASDFRLKKHPLSAMPLGDFICMPIQPAPDEL